MCPPPPAHREKKIQRLAISKREANTVYLERPTLGLTKKKADSHRGDAPKPRCLLKLKTQRKMRGESRYRFKGDILGDSLADLDGIMA